MPVLEALAIVHVITGIAKSIKWMADNNPKEVKRKEQFLADQKSKEAAERYAHEKDMQKERQLHESAMLERKFTHENAMQDRKEAFEEMMIDKRFEQDIVKEMLRQHHSIERDENEALRRNFVLRGITPILFEKDLRQKIEACEENRRVPSPFLIPIFGNCEHYNIEAIDFSQSIGSLRMFGVGGVYDIQGESPVINYTGGWSVEKNSPNTIYNFWLLYHYYPMAIVSPEYHRPENKLKLVVYYWGPNSRKIQDGPSQAILAEMSLGDFEKALDHPDVQHELKERGSKGELLEKKQRLTVAMLQLFQLWTAFGISMVADTYHMNISGRAPQMLPALRQSFPRLFEDPNFKSEISKIADIVWDLTYENCRWPQMLEVLEQMIQIPELKENSEKYFEQVIFGWLKANHEIQEGGGNLQQLIDMLARSSNNSFLQNMFTSRVKRFLYLTEQKDLARKLSWYSGSLY